MEREDEERTEEPLDIYVNPPNYIALDKIPVKWIETGAVECILAFFLWKLPLLMMPKIIVMMFAMVPVGALFMIGIYDESVCQFIISYFRFLKKRKILHLRRPGYEGQSKNRNGKPKFRRTNSNDKG